MIALSDHQLEIVVTAANAVPVERRDVFSATRRRLATAEDKVPERPVKLVAERSAHNIAGNFV